MPARPTKPKPDAAGLSKFTDMSGKPVYVDLSMADALLPKQWVLNDGKYPATTTNKDGTPLPDGTLIHLKSGVTVHVQESPDELHKAMLDGQAASEED